MKEEAVDLSNGAKYLVKRPTLAGWKAIFESIPQDDLNKVFDLWQKKAEGDGEQDPLAFSQLLFGSLPKFPDMAAAVMAACLAGDDGKRCVSVEAAVETFDDDDVMQVLVALSSSGFFADIVARAKNLLGRGKQTPGEAE